MMSKIYKFNGKLFRYDDERCVVQLVAKAGAEEMADEAEWKAKYGRPLFGIDADGYMVLSSAGLRRDNWKNREVRDEYLSEWCCELDEEAEALAADFAKYELPYLV